MHRSVVPAALVGLLALVGSARADVALDYHSKAKGCAAADRVADEVSAKLGFVPWDPQAPVAIRVRITADGDDRVGTIEQPDGTSRVLRAATCAKLGEALVSVIALALDRPVARTAPASPPARDDRRLQRLERDLAPDRLVTVQLRAKDGRELEISRVIAAHLIYGYSGSAGVMSVEKLCKKLPCTAQLSPGTHTLVVHDLASGAGARDDAEIRVSSTLEIDYVSRAATRRSTVRRTGWGLAIGFVAGTIASAYLVETQLDHSRSGSRALHALDPLGGMIGGIVVGLIARATTDGHPADEAHFTVRPGLHDATAHR